MALDTEQPRTKNPATATDTDRLCQTGATTVDHDRLMRLRCRHDRAWPCPTGLVVATNLAPKSIQKAGAARCHIRAVFQSSPAKQSLCDPLHTDVSSWLISVA